MSHTPEPFGYFRPDPCGWSDCAETDDDAIPLFDKATIRIIEKQRDELLRVIELAADQIRKCDYTPARSTLLVALREIKGGA